MTSAGQIPAVTQAYVQVRRAGRDDVPRIASILAESFAEFVNLYTPEAYAATTPAAPQVEQRMKEGPVWVAVQNDTLVGTVSAVQKNRSVYIRGMAVVPPCRGLGVGEMLLNEAEVFARKSGSMRLFLSTTPFLAAAIALYERRGFQRTGEDPHDLFGTPLFTMSKELNLGNEF